MFGKSAPSSQPDLFSSFELHFNRRKQDRLNDPKSWHNLFYEHVTSRVDEDLFSVLRDANEEGPGAPIRRLVSMVILKEGFGWNDAELFDHCRFNILVMRALGLVNLTDEAPAESTYYRFKHALFEYHLKVGRELIGETLSCLTGTQANAFRVFGQQVRLDRKSIGSNIVLCCRLHLVARCIRAFWGSLDKDRKRRFSTKKQVLDGLLKAKSYQVVYDLNRAEQGEKLQEFGQLLRRLQATYSESDSDLYGLIMRVMADQYNVLSSSKQVLPKPPQEISPFSLQYADVDAEAAVRSRVAKLEDLWSPDG